MMSVGSFTRRALLRAGGGLGLAGGLLGSGAAKAGPLLVPRLGDQESSQHTNTPIPRPINPTELFIYQAERRFGVDQGLRLNGLDPDIAAYRSVSPVMKAHMQKVRDYRRISIFERLHRKAGHQWW